MTTKPVKRMADDATQCRRVVYRVYKEVDPEFFDFCLSFSNNGLNKLAYTLLQNHWQQLKAAGRLPQMPSALAPTVVSPRVETAPAEVPAPAPAAPAPVVAAVPETPAQPRREPSPSVIPEPAAKAQAPARQPRDEGKPAVRPAPAAASVQVPAAPAKPAAPAAAATEPHTPAPPPAAEPPSIVLGPMTSPAAANRPAGPKQMSADRRKAWLRTGE